MNEVNSYSGKLTEKKEKQTGISAKGGWIRQDFIIQTDGKYPKLVMFSAFNKTVDYLDKKQVGDSITVDFDITCKKSNGSDYNSVTAVKVL